MNLYCRLKLVRGLFCVAYVGGEEARAPAFVEPTLKYHPEYAFALTSIPLYQGDGHFQLGSLTGAVSSQRVTEESKGHLSLFGNQA